ncbi:PilZ domain-containing protein [Sphingomonas sp. IC-11]|uniref:PilZ domain-containing protein n=1 Tax=Sphingomonas sp. IC-11 TaxID=2898528 RepID=UPI001E344D01|nr:PilZ domain-containing protein [Sphingomonas sp. IC-11]MCD2315855.1 PilZ domain-containing protein [Sphingomonas sp. IC-11]
MFAAEYEPAETTGRRRSPRAPVSFDARVGDGGLRRTLCKIVDISIDGARMQTHSALRVGSSIWLTLPLAGTLSADVMWADDFTAGCRFNKPLRPDIFKQLLVL